MLRTAIESSTRDSNGNGLNSSSSSQEMQVRAQTALRASPIYLLRQILVEQNGSSLLLSGRVDTYYHKQLAQEVVRAVCDEIRVINTIAVDV